MDIFFQDPTAIPLPPKDVRILKLDAEPLPDKQRVRVYLELTPFQKRPNGEVIVRNSSGEELANLSFIQTINPKMEFTVHLRGAEAGGENTVSATVFYLEIDEDEDADEIINLDEKRDIVDEAETTFKI